MLMAPPADVAVMGLNPTWHVLALHSNRLPDRTCTCCTRITPRRRRPACCRSTASYCPCTAAPPTGPQRASTCRSGGLSTGTRLGWVAPPGDGLQMWIYAVNMLRSLLGFSLPPVPAAPSGAGSRELLLNPVGTCIRVAACHRMTVFVRERSRLLSTMCCDAFCMQGGDRGVLGHLAQWLADEAADKLKGQAAELAK